MMKRTPLRRRSAAVAAMFTRYRPELAARIKAVGNVCECCRANCGRLDGHHYAGSKRGANLLRFVVIGRRCHDFIHDHGNAARAGGWLAQINGELAPNPAVAAAEKRFAEMTADTPNP